MLRINILRIKYAMFAAIVVIMPVNIAYAIDSVARPACSVIGSGKLGLPLAVILAKHFETVTVDINPEIVAAINNRKSPVAEPGLQELLLNSELTATTNIEDAIKRTNVTFIIVPTPSTADGTFTNKYVLDAITKVGAAIAKKDSYHLVSITSTVMPGSTSGVIKAALEQTSGRKIGERLGLTYNPEFIALGDVINGIEHPDMVLIGEPKNNSKAGNLLVDLYSKICPNQPSIMRTSYINAEMAKLALNTYLTMKITYANTLAEICDALPNADAKEITRIIAHDSRISPKFLTPGTPFGGPCLPRDTVAFSAVGKSVGISTDNVNATKIMNERHLDWLVKKISKLANPKKDQIAILGLSYKPGTDVTDASTGIALAHKLIHKGFRVVAYDPLLKNNLGIELQTNLQSCIENANVVVVTTNDKEFYDLKNIALNEKKFPAIVFDCWRMFKTSDMPTASLLHIGTANVHY